MKALVTGATGFLGSHIVDACLARGVKVAALVRDGSDTRYLEGLGEVDLRRGDLARPETLPDATRGIDVVYHSAARVVEHGSRRDFYEANVEGTLALVAAAKQSGVKRFVFVSSPSVITDGKDQLDVDESYPPPARFLNLYSETKAVAERGVLAANSREMMTCAIRPRAVYGPRDRQGYMPKLIAKLLAGKMPDMSGGRTVMASLCYVENAARACLLAGDSDAAGGKAYFVTDRERVNVWEFMAALGAEFGAPPISRRVSPRALAVAVAIIEAIFAIPPIRKRYPPPLSRYSLSLLTRSGTYSIARAKADLGYEPPVSQAEGLRRLRAWIESIGGVSEYVRHVK